MPHQGIDGPGSVQLWKKSVNQQVHVLSQSVEIMTPLHGWMTLTHRESANMPLDSEETNMFYMKAIHGVAAKRMRYTDKWWYGFPNAVSSTLSILSHAFPALRSL